MKHTYKMSIKLWFTERFKAVVLNINKNNYE
jgi:hypothetical protein